MKEDIENKGKAIAQEDEMQKGTGANRKSNIRNLKN